MVGGHSWGATLALAYAVRHPDRTAALLYISGTRLDPAWHAEYWLNRAAKLGPDGEQRLAALSQRLSRADGKEASAIRQERDVLSLSADFADRSRARTLAGTLLESGFDVNPEVVQIPGQTGRRFIEDPSVREQVAALRVPALILHGTADPRPLWPADQLTELLPHATLHTLDGVGHYPWLEGADEFRTVIRTFLAVHCL